MTGGLETADTGPNTEPAYAARNGWLRSAPDDTAIVPSDWKSEWLPAASQLRTRAA